MFAEPRYEHPVELDQHVGGNQTKVDPRAEVAGFVPDDDLRGDGYFGALEDQPKAALSRRLRATVDHGNEVSALAAALNLAGCVPSAQLFVRSTEYQRSTTREDASLLPHPNPRSRAWSSAEGTAC